jgi:hypothetical protein
MKNVGRARKADLTKFLTLCLIAVGVGFLSSTWLSAMQGQNEQSNLVTHIGPPNSPIEIPSIDVKGKSIKLGEKFDGREDWLNGLSLKIKNVSDKVVVYVGLYLDFPETKATGNIMSFPLSFGQNPISPMISGESQRLLPNEIVSLSLSAQEYTHLKNFIERRQRFSNIRKADVRLTIIAFEDGSVWSNGSWMRRDPDNPHRLIPIENQ